MRLCIWRITQNLLLGTFGWKQIVHLGIWVCALGENPLAFGDRPLFFCVHLGNPNAQNEFWERSSTYVELVLNLREQNLSGTSEFGTLWHHLFMLPNLFKKEIQVFSFAKIFDVIRSIFSTGKQRYKRKCESVDFFLIPVREWGRLLLEE